MALVAAMAIACTAPASKKTAGEKTGALPETKVERFGMVTGLKPGQVVCYKQLHAAVWPAVKQKITECNIRNYSIYLKEIDGEPYLFSYWEYVGTDFTADMKKMAADSTTQRWWKETAPTQLPLPDAAAKGETWSRMEEVFHQD
ncbi:L-rhamnose mutarotase [Niabella sp. 3A5MI-3]|nr:L-rhamnose mutarotase [Niabella beijingensis]